MRAEPPCTAPSRWRDAPGVARPYRRVMRSVSGLIAVVLLVSGCSFDKAENPYQGLDPAPLAETILEDLNLASLGLRARPCVGFDSPVSRCYEPDQWMSIREGRETLGHLHRQLVEAGARYWGSTDSPTTSQGPPVVSNLDIGCYFDYETGDFPLRVVIVGPSGEEEPCVNGLPGDGISQVWIIGAGFDPEVHYDGVVMSDSFEILLRSLPPQLYRSEDVFGGEASTVDGYYGPELPRSQDEYGIHILPETVSVTSGIARGLVQYGGFRPLDVPAGGTSGEEDGDQVASGQRHTTGAVDVVVEVGGQRYAVPVVIREGESAPFEITLPSGFDVNDLRIAPGWSHTDVDWRGGQRFSGPISETDCGKGIGLDEGDIEALKAGKGQECLAFEAQSTTVAGMTIVVQAVVATFAEDGTITEVTDPFVTAQGVEPSIGQATIIFPDVVLLWIAPADSAASTGVWVRYAEYSEVNG